MDIQVASNFERLLYEAHGRNASKVQGLMSAFAQSGSLTLEPEALAAVQRTFVADCVQEAETIATMKHLHRDANLTVDPHTAVGLTATRKAAETEDVVTLATAHPAKFSQAVETATGTTPTLPERMRWILAAPERYETLPNAIGPLKDFIARG